MTHDELIAAIESMSVLELSQLVKALETKFGVSAAAPMMMAGAMPAGGAAAVAAEPSKSRPSSMSPHLHWRQKITSSR